MKTYTVVCGVYGVGKSTFTGALMGLSASDVPVVNKNQSEAMEYLSRGSSVIHETTLSDSTTMENVLFALERGYRVNIFYIATSSAEESIRRIRNRVEKGGHDIDESTIRERFASRFDRLVELLPLASSVVIYDNENGFIPFATFERGKLIKLTELKADWFDELKRKNDEYQKDLKNK